MPLYQEDLVRPHGPCSVPGCGEVHPDDSLWFHANCHLASPTWARYAQGVLTIQCARCERDIVALHVAQRPGASQAEAARSEAPRSEAPTSDAGRSQPRRHDD
ncbi:MAG: hypothetical protein O2894_09375 [Planctomycetota bacterium]|nr:hypothetical protein [Planctomycetota bacterium]